MDAPTPRARRSLARPNPPTGPEIQRILVIMDGGLILLVFLALLFAWLLNRVRRAIRLGPIGYVGVMVVFVIVMLVIWGQTMR